jgi:hypothetical protein
LNQESRHPSLSSFPSTHAYSLTVKTGTSKLPRENEYRVSSYY